MRTAKDADWLDVSVAAKILDVTPQTLRNWKRNGWFEGKVRMTTTPGGTTRYHEQDLHDFKEGMIHHD